MVFHFLRVRLALLVTLLAVFICLAPAWCDTTPTPARTVEGIAATADGKALARVTLYLFGLPPGQTDMITLGDQSTVVTDDRGHFTWTVPDALPPLSDYIETGSISCYALAVDRGATRFHLAVRPNWHGTDAEGAARDLLEQATRLCETKWQTSGAHPVFSVVVPDMSVVLLAVRGPDGQPLHAREVQVVSVGHPRDYEGAVVYTVKTDAAGRLHLRCFPGSLRFQVFVPGLGFGSTGMFDAGAGQSVAPVMPPLAPFARLSGTVSPMLAGPGAAISLDTNIPGENVWYDPRAAVDVGGRWTLMDVLPGQYRLVLTGGRGESEPAWVTVQPGEQVSGITVGPKQPPSEKEALVYALLRKPSPPAITLPDTAPSVRGRVTDADGTPVAGADVYAVCSYPAGMGYRQKVLTAKTDAAGAYQIPGLPTGDGQTGEFEPLGPSVHLVAHLAGFGLAAADEKIEKGQVSGGWMDVQKDLVLPASHAELTVQVLQDGKPLPNVLVALAAQGESSVIPAMYRESDRGEAAQDLRALLAPSAQTGPDGAARFHDLTPGLWDVAANRTSYPDLLSGKPAAPFNVSAGVIVRAGENLSYTVSLLPQPGEVAFRVVDPGGLPFAVPPAALSVTTASESNYGNLTLTPDGAGNGRAEFGASGLFQVTARAGDRPLDINVLAGPYFEGTVLVAVSPATAARSPITIPTRRIGPASIRVRLQDAQGKTLRGAVTVGDSFNSARYAASVDADGMAVFPNMPLNFFKYTVTAHFAGRPAIAALSQTGGPLPSDTALLAGLSQPPPQTVVVRGGEETSVTFGPQPPGYVRLRLTGPLASVKGYYVDGRLPTDEAFVPTQFDPTTGEYLFGPLPAGRRTFHLFRSVSPPVDTNLNAGEVTVTVKAGQIVHATLTAQSTVQQEGLYSSSLSGSVYLSDGKTPAWGARAALFLPERSGPLRMARTDTQGHLTLKDFWRSNARIRDITTGAAMAPLLAAWLPGANGAVMVPFQPGRDERLVLPAPISLHGRVTVGGKTVLNLPSLFRIRAMYQGQGKMTEALIDALSVEATAQADGTFRLGGLTPGTYQMQAARDGIWLSETQTVTVGTEALPELTLDIAPPGAPVILHLEDWQGKPRPGQELRIARPDGPLTEEIWPALLKSDSAGVLRVDGLEAGHHLVAISGRAGESIGFDVPVSTPTVQPATRWIVIMKPVGGFSR